MCKRIRLVLFENYKAFIKLYKKGTLQKGLTGQKKVNKKRVQVINKEQLKKL